MKIFREEIMALIADSYPNNELKERDLRIALRHFGWDGKGGASLQLTGTEHGLTRERVRQIASNVAGNLAPLAHKHLTLLPVLMSEIAKIAPASAKRVERHLSALGLGDDRIEGALKAASLFSDIKHDFRIIDESGHRYIILPDMEGLSMKIIAQTQKTCGHLGMVCIEDLRYLVPDLPAEIARNYIRDVLSTRKDAEWLDIDKTWVWLREAPINRLITCLHKMLTIFSSTTVSHVVIGANRYYKKGGRPESVLKAPNDIVASFINRWGQASVSAAGIVRKTSSFESTANVLEFEERIVRSILSKPEKTAREKELENELVPLIDGKTNPKKYNFSVHLNYSPLICKGDKRGEYIATGFV